MFFLFILIITTLSIAGCAAFFSIVGLAAIFSGSFWSVVIMGSVLEAGKLVAASFVYRYWQILSFLMRTYLIIAILVLMAITSIGIYGKLSAAHQQDMLPLEELQAKMVLLKDEKQRIEDRKKEMDQQITQMPANYITARQRLMKSFAPELEKINARLETITAEEYKLTNKELQQRVHTGPVVFIAKVLDYDVVDATSWMILAIIFAFDPLAVVLTIGFNIALVQRRKEREELAAVSAPVEEVVSTPVEEPVEEHHYEPPHLEKVVDHDIDPVDDVEVVYVPEDAPAPAPESEEESTPTKKPDDKEHHGWEYDNKDAIIAQKNNR
jgi:hypothetical protein